MQTVDLTGKEFGGVLIVEGYNKEKSKINNKAMYNCRCKLCGEIHIKSKPELMSGNIHLPCTRALKNSETLLARYKNEALSMVGQFHGTSEIIGYDEERTNEEHTTYIKLKCGCCGKIYSAKLKSVKDNRYKLCGDCSARGVNHVNFRDFSNQTIGDYNVLKYHHSESKGTTNTSYTYWLCNHVSDPTKYCVVKNDSLYYINSLDPNKRDISDIRVKEKEVIFPFKFVDNPEDNPDYNIDKKKK